MQGGAGAEPDPCVFYLHLNEAGEVIYPSTAVSLSLSLSLSLSQSNRHWSLCQARWPTVLFSSSKVSPLPFICTWERPWPHTLLPCSSPLHVDLTSPESSPVLCVCVCVCLFELADTCMQVCVRCAAYVCGCSSVSGPVYVDQDLCLCSPIDVCVCEYVQIHFYGAETVNSQQSLGSSESLVCPCWCFGAFSRCRQTSLCCRSATGSSYVAEWVRVHLAPVWIGLQGNEWLSLLLKDGLRGINILRRSFASFRSTEAQQKVFQDDLSLFKPSFLYTRSSLKCVHIILTCVHMLCSHTDVWKHCCHTYILQIWSSLPDWPEC